MNKIILSLFLSGLLLGSGPCLATCGPVLISYIAATRQNPKQAILVWLLFSLSRICVYLILSVAIFLLGEFLVKQNIAYVSGYIYFFGGIIIALIGVLTIIGDSKGVGHICSIVSEQLNKRLLRIQPIALGVIMGLLPCAPLLAVLSYIGLVSLAWQQCIFLSLIFGLGTLISPLILLALGAGVVPKLLLNRPRVYRILRIICGVIIVFFGVQLVIQVTHGSIILP